MAEKDDPERTLISELVGNMQILPLPENETPTDVFLLVKTTDGSGDATWYARTAGDLSREELLGSLSIQIELIRRDLLNQWIDT